MAKSKGVGAILATLVLLLSASFAHADDQSFVVKKIQLEGLQRISDGTLYDYLPVNIGDTMDAAHVQQAIRALYKTGFFKDVELRRDGDTLVVVVQERPSIAHFAYAIFIDDDADIGAQRVRRAIEQAPGIDDLDVAGLRRLCGGLRQPANEKDGEQNKSGERPAN